jgi:crotonobetainyl-CoA:carnitine CoA-transferase CaiB-like acyl-CoA transferase
VLDRCFVLDWAACGAMALTGFPGEPPAASPAAAFGLLGQVTERLAEATRAVGTQVRAHPAELIAGRAALTGLTRRGQVSAGGSSRLLRTADGWCAITLSRATDREAIPAVLGSLGAEMPGLSGAAGAEVEAGLNSGAWLALESAARMTPAAEFAAAAQLLGVPAAALPAGSRDGPRDGPSDVSWPPWRLTRIAPADSGARLAGAVVVDLSSMWAGPLCARLLGLAGATVIKIESPDRPDGARAGNREFYDWLHAGHRSVTVDFKAGRDTLGSLLAAADVVIEASRPRALANLGLAPGTIPHKKGQVWVSITGYGRAEPDQVAFGDDAAVAGGLVGWAKDEPVFCADAAADPLTGVCAALAATQSLAEGGGHLIDLPMRSVAAAFAYAPGPDHGPHEVKDDVVTCHASGQRQRVLQPRLPVAPGKAAADLGADTEAVLAWLASASC